MTNANQNPITEEYAIVRLLATCIQVNDKEAELRIPTRPLTREECEVLNRLFPDLESAVGDLITKQTLLNSLL